MKLNSSSQRIYLFNTKALTGLTLMVMHILGYITGWAWPMLYVILILSAIGDEHIKKEN